MIFPCNSFSQCQKHTKKNHQFRILFDDSLDSYNDTVFSNLTLLVQDILISPLRYPFPSVHNSLDLYRHLARVNEWLNIQMQVVYLPEKWFWEIHAKIYLSWLLWVGTFFEKALQSSQILSFWLLSCRLSHIIFWVSLQLNQFHFNWVHQDLHLAIQNSFVNILNFKHEQLIQTKKRHFPSKLGIIINFLEETSPNFRRGWTELYIFCLFKKFIRHLINRQTSENIRF